MARSNNSDRSTVVDEVGITTDTLTSRGGLNLYVRYLIAIGLMPLIERLFGGVRKSSKGQAVTEVFKQLLCFFMDGTSRHLVHFDVLKEDPGYAAAIETDPKRMQSSHAVKRFLGGFSWFRIWLFRRLLLKLFIWRLKLAQPDVVQLGMDTMVMDNDEAEKRHGVQPTYKKVKGFKPFFITWDRFIIDAVFRGGKKHCNNGDTVAQALRHVVAKIRSEYRADVAIVLRNDSGFFDQKLFKVWEQELGIGYVSAGKIYDDVKEYVTHSCQEHWQTYKNGKQTWQYLEMGSRREEWSKFRRAIFTHLVHGDDGQMLLDFARPTFILYTNLGTGSPLDEQLKAAGFSHLLEPRGLIQCAHARGCDELIHRALKEFGSEELPFKRFAPNAAYFYTMLVAFFIYEAFKEDVCREIVPVEAYPTTLRRMVIDVAAKIVRTGGKIILKVTKSTWEYLQWDKLWGKSGDPPPIPAY
jgi:hypothetical protein